MNRTLLSSKATCFLFLFTATATQSNLPFGSQVGNVCHVCCWSNTTMDVVHRCCGHLAPTKIMISRRQSNIATKCFSIIHIFKNKVDETTTQYKKKENNQVLIIDIYIYRYHILKSWMYQQGCKLSYSCSP